MKSGTRALGVAVSAGEATGDAPARATVAGAVVRADRVTDGFVLASTPVGGRGTTDAVCSLHDRLARQDLQYLLLAGVAPAWFDVVDLARVRESTGLPVLAVSFEASEGLEGPLGEHFSGDELADRLSTYESLPPRHPVAVNDERVFVRAVGVDEADATRVVRAYTPEGGRPEPLRVARHLARAGDAYAARLVDGDGG